eukprot:scaffold58971_cov45-Phaeocystis_antarctica.AAC.2
MDDDGSGRITYYELVDMVRNELRIHSDELQDSSLKSVWAALDDDGSGFITAGEFGSFMRKGEVALRMLRPQTTWKQKLAVVRRQEAAAVTAALTPTLHPNPNPNPNPYRNRNPNPNPNPNRNPNPYPNPNPNPSPNPTPNPSPNPTPHQVTAALNKERNAMVGVEPADEMQIAALSKRLNMQIARIEPVPTKQSWCAPRILGLGPGYP